MKKSQTRGQRLVWLCGLAFIVAGCDNPTNPTSPSAVPAPGAGIIAPLGVGAGPQTASTPIAVGAGPQNSFSTQRSTTREIYGVSYEGQRHLRAD